MSKSDKTKDQLFRALCEICKGRTLDEITIEELTDYCGKKRGIFYYHFHDKAELLFYGFNRYLPNNLLTPETATKSLKEYLHQDLDFCVRNRDLIYALTKGSGTLLRPLEEYLYRDIERFLNYRIAPEEFTEELQLKLLYVSHGIAGIFFHWVHSDFQKPAHEIAELIWECFPDSLKTILS